ncbi:MAG: OmpA family protein [Alphaproteobacteria bacterium]|jgi:outer membrane protein OmpA-like peptidoglycan-associated protein|nr:OmpA family protein [Alphaproteobacteria bacterium]
MSKKINILLSLILLTSCSSNSNNDKYKRPSLFVSKGMNISIKDARGPEVLTSKTQTIEVNSNEIKEPRVHKISFIDLEDKNEFNKPSPHIHKEKAGYPYFEEKTQFEKDLLDKTTTEEKKLVKTIYFKNGSANFTKSEKEAIRKIAENCKSKNCEIDIEAYSSSTSNTNNKIDSKIINLRMSNKRANETANLFKKYGINKIETIAFGDSNENKNLPEKENRKVNIFITY